MKGKPPFTVLLTRGAEMDLEALYDYIAGNDSPAKADNLLDQLMEVATSLSRFPGRGSYPGELAALGIREYRQVTFKTYRLVYRLHGTQVVIHLIADGRRNMQSLLARRLLGG